MFISARKTRSASGALTSTPLRSSATSIALSVPATARLSPAKTSASSRLTAGPATAIANSWPGERESCLNRASPPSSQRSMPSISMPLRRAVNAWPSSCAMSDAKKRTAEHTATTNPSVWVPPRVSWKYPARK